MIKLPIFLFALLLSTNAFAATSGLTCSIIPVLTQYFLRAHVLIHNQTDEINERIVEQFIKRLDPSKALLLKSDVDTIKPKTTKLLRSLSKKPDCSEMEGIKSLLIQRAKDQLEFAKEALGKKYKLDENVELQLDPDKRVYASSKEEAHKLQMVQIHFQISNYLLTDMKLDKAKKQLVHRYELTVKRMEELKESDIYGYFVNAFASALDPHSSYMQPEDTEDFRINMGISLEGIGASLSSEDGYTVIQELIPGGPAAKSNQLMAKDKIIAVGQGKNKEMEDVIDMDLREVVRKIRGPSGTVVRLTVLREKPEIQRFNLTLTRSKVQLEDEAAKVEFQNRTIDGKKYKLAKIELPGFYGGQRGARSSYTDMLKAVQTAAKEKADGILLDLSTNGGGLLDEAVKIAGLFINKGNVVAVKDSDNDVQMLDDIDSRVQFSGPIVVLVSRLSASASEIVAGALRDYKRALIVGSDHTYGKGSVQAVLPLQSEYGIIKVTTGLFYVPGGNSTQHKGVTSDISFPSPYSAEDVGEKNLDYSLKQDSIPPFLSPEANQDNSWVPVSKAEVEKLHILSQARVEKSKAFADITKDLKEMEARKGLIKLSDMRKKEAESKKKDKNKAPKALAKERVKPITDEAISILADFVHLRKNGSGNLIGQDHNKTASDRSTEIK